MVGIRQRGEQIRQFILAHVEQHPHDIAKLTAETFAISRQSVNKHLQHLVLKKALYPVGMTRNRHYVIQPLLEWEHVYALDGQLAEDEVWRKDVAPLLGELPGNVINIWHYGFTEMLNNAMDHSSGSRVMIELEKTATHTEIRIDDDGEGIFKKIQRNLGLHDERHALLELAKGKLTTDPERHSGEGIFFSSRMFDSFAISSGHIEFMHDYDDKDDWIFENRQSQPGTVVYMKLRNNTSRTVKEIFDTFASGEDYGFTKTIVPVRLAQYGNEELVSRSQAKRLLARIDKFKSVIFDFAGVAMIGQAFADEVFRVFAHQHPQIELIHINASQPIQQMINRALTHKS